MLTKEELAKDPAVIAAAKVDDSLFPLLSPLQRATVQVSRRLIAEYSVGSI